MGKGCCGPKYGQRTETGKQTSGSVAGKLKPGSGAKAVRQMTESAPGSGQIRPAKLGADEGPGIELGAQCGTV